MNDSIIVYGETKERAYNKLENLLEEMKHRDIANVKKSSYEFVVILKNDDVYKAVGTSNNARGIKWQYAYIDSTIDGNLIDNVILPSFIPKLVNGEYDANAKIADRVIWY